MIKEKGIDTLIRLGDIAETRRGITSGANTFFFVRVKEIIDGNAHIICDDGSDHWIEEKFVKNPVITKARELLTPILSVQDLEYRAVFLDETVSEHHLAQDYIKYGESKGYHQRSTTKSRANWYQIQPHEAAQVLIPIGHKRRPAVGLSNGLYSNDNFVEAILPDFNQAKLVAGSILSSFTMLSYEIFGRANFGQGLLKTQTYEIANLPVINPTKIPETAKIKFEEAFNSLSNRPPLIIYDDIRQADRIELDAAFLLVMGFENPTERTRLVNMLQDATCRMIWTRMAKSGNARESRLTYEKWLESEVPFDLRIKDEEYHLT